MYYTVIKHNGNLRTRRKCRKHEPQASVFCISRVICVSATTLPSKYILKVLKGIQSFRTRGSFVPRRFVLTFDQFVPNPLVDSYPTNYDTKCLKQTETFTSFILVITKRLKPGFHMIATIAAIAAILASIWKHTLYDLCDRCDCDRRVRKISIVGIHSRNDRKDRRVYVSICSQGSPRLLCCDRCDHMETRLSLPLLG